MPTIRSALAFALAAALAVTGRAQEPDPEAKDAVVFLPLAEKGEGAPDRAGLGRTVIVAAARSGDPWWRVAEALREAGPRDLLSVFPFRPERVRQALQKLKPEFLVVVLPPELLDVNVHFELLEQLARLDDDPFLDVAFGYVTGASADEALAFAKGTVAARKRGPERSILEFGPSSRPAPLSAPTPHPWADGFTTRRLAHPEGDAGVASALKAAGRAGVLQAWGHGMPAGVDDGLKGRQIREAGLALAPSLYFSGPCYCGVPGRWFDPSGGTIKEAEVAREDSFLLALLDAGVSAAFAGLDPDRGETNHQELEHLLTSGDALGHAAKSTYDDVVLAYRRPALALPRYEPGKRDPHRNLAETMIAGGACRALFGDPSWAPFAKAGTGPFAIEAQVAKKALRIAWVRDEPIGSFWAPVDVFRADGRWTHRLRFRCAVPLDKARRARSLRVHAVTKDGRDLAYAFPTAALELFGGKAYLHAMLVFPPNEDDRALWNGKRFEARLEIAAP